MALKKKFSLAIIDSEKISEINKIVLKHSVSIKQFSSYYYFNVTPTDYDDFVFDITFFELESENESCLDKKLKDLIEEINQLNTLYALRDEDTKELVVEIEHVTTLNIKFDNVKVLKKGTYEKIDEIKNNKTKFGVCKIFNPSFRSLENVSIDGKDIEPEVIYLFSDTAEDLSKLKTEISEKVMKINPDFEIEFKPFEFTNPEFEKLL